ncbi:MAG: hypothetical protein JEZ08_06915 [Clostridiales bacterium]|nr:hypothetical protein [Clostridiales bacterium]
MAAFFSISIGLFVAIFSLVMIRREVMKASFFKHVKLNDGDTDAIINQLRAIEITVDEMNQSFYDIASDLEGKFSMHEKEIEIIDQKINDINLLTKDLSKMLNYQGKEIATFKKPNNREVDKKVEEKSIVKEEPDIKNEIMRLKALGMDDQQIARQLNKGIREINMIMNFIK